MSLINERHVDTDRAGGGNYGTLMDFLNRADIYNLPFREVGIAVSSAQCALISNSVITGNLAIGSGTSERDGGIVAARLPTSVSLGTGDTAHITDGLGNILNLVQVRDASDNDPILEVGGRVVYGLFQADSDDSTYPDGSPIADTGSENCQVSFVYLDNNGAMQLVAIDATVEIAFNTIYSLRNLPSLMKVGGVPKREIIDSTSALSLKCRKFTVVNPYAANEVIDTSSGAGSLSGTATPTGDAILSIGSDEPSFNSACTTRVFLNGSELSKDDQVHWDSSTSFHIAVPMDTGDIFGIEVQGA